MTIKAADMSFQPPLKNTTQIIAMLSALHAAYQEAVVIKANEIAAAGIPDREARRRLFDAYTEKITKATKGLLTERVPISDEAAGIGAALELIMIVHRGIREQI